MLGAPDIRVILEARLDKLKDGHPVFGAVEENDVNRGTVNGHPVDTDEGFHVQPGRLVCEYADMIQRIGLGSRARYERLVGTSDRAHPVRPASVLDGRDVCWIPLIVDVLSGLGTEVSPVHRKRDGRDQDDCEYYETLDSGDLDVKYSLGACEPGHERYPDQDND